MEAIASLRAGKQGAQSYIKMLVCQEDRELCDRRFTEKAWKEVSGNKRENRTRADFGGFKNHKASKKAEEF
jgi:hypothetical protein